jgi:thiol:disulfide interchange protein DsbD
VVDDSWVFWYFKRFGDSEPCNGFFGNLAIMPSRQVHCVLPRGNHNPGNAMSFRLTIVAQILMAILMATTSPAQPKVLSPKLFLSKKSALPGQEIRVALQLDIEKGWHINAHKPLETSLVPTEVVLETDLQFKLERIRYPEAKRKAFEFSGGELAVYEGKVLILMDLAVSAEASPGKGRISGKVTYQACDDRSCLLPAEVAFSASIPITEDPAQAYPTHPEIFRPSERAMPPERHPSAAIPLERGWFLSLLIIFLGGLGLNLTPCIYPLIPITIGFFVAQGADRPRWVFVLSLFYVLGMAITYSILGTLAALTGSLFGSALQNPFVLLLIAFVLVGLSLSMFGLYEIRIPGFLTRIAGRSSYGIFGALFMGLTVGILAAPCIGPFVIGLLSYVGQKGDPVLGFWTFFVLALGLGTPFLFLGTLAGSLSRLPRSGEWMVWVRKIFGFVLLGMAVYFVRYLISNQLYWLLQASIAAVGSIYLGWVEGSGKGVRGFRGAKWGTGIFGLLLSSYLVLAPGHLFFHREAIQWLDYDEKLVQRALTEAKPVIIDFTADWCVPCREMEYRTFSSPPVIAKAKQFVTLRVDLTHSTKPENRSFMERYRIKGVPTVIFLGRNGKEIENLRFYEVIKPEEFLRKMEKTLEAH